MLADHRCWWTFFALFQLVGHHAHAAQAKRVLKPERPQALRAGYLGSADRRLSYRTQHAWLTRCACRRDLWPGAVALWRAHIWSWGFSAETIWFSVAMETQHIRGTI
jgi:hypothetical protein